MIFRHLTISILLLLSLNSQAQNTSIPKTGDEFVGPFDSWLNAKTGFGAKGDGIADDTRALQAAFDAAAKGQANTTLYLPEGVYRITGTLVMNYQINVSIVGADPATTIIKWAGAAHGTMMRLNGTAYSKFDRLTFNGNRVADIAVDQSWDGAHPHFDTGNEYADDWFIDVGFGIRGGALGHGFAETSILRARFIRNTMAGVSLGNFNALDIWIRNSLFQDCAVGVTNTYGAGNFKVYQCLFRNSTKHDISMGNTGEFSIRGNTSINSNDFLNAGSSRNPAPTIIIGNTIIDPVTTQAISVGNQGPVLFLNNTIRSRNGVTSGTVAQLGTNTLSAGNTFTVADAVSLGSNSAAYRDKTVAFNNLKNLAAPPVYAPEPNLHRRVFEVPAGSDATAIQAIINKAAKFSGDRPVVHFPYANYNISATLNIPEGSDVQLAGDGFGDVHPTMLMWTGSGAGPIIRIAGPGKATLRDLTFKGNGEVTNILISNADQKGARIFLQEFHQVGGQTGLFANGLDKALIFGYDSQFAGVKKAVSVFGRASRGEGKTILYSGAESGNTISHEVSGNGSLVIQDTWYEGGNKSTWAKLSGNGVFIASGNHITTPQHTEVPSVVIRDFTGKALFATNDLADRFSLSGNNTGARILAIGLLSEADPMLEDKSSRKPDIRLLLNRTRNYGSKMLKGGSYTVDDVGTHDDRYIAEMVSGMINVPAIKLNSLPAGVSDVRFFRVMSINGGIGLNVEPGKK